MSERDPRVDPEPGDLVSDKVSESMALVLSVRRDDDDPDLGPETVHVREDTRWGQRLRSSMSLETWRARCEYATVLDSELADVFNEGGIKAVKEAW